MQPKEQRGTLCRRSRSIRREAITEELIVKTTKHIRALYWCFIGNIIICHYTKPAIAIWVADPIVTIEQDLKEYHIHRIKSFISQVLNSCHRVKFWLQYYYKPETGYGNNLIQYHIHRVETLEALLHSNPLIAICIFYRMVPLQYTLIQYHIHHKSQTIKVCYVSPPQICRSWYVYCKPVRPQNTSVPYIGALSCMRWYIKIYQRAFC